MANRAPSDPATRELLAQIKRRRDRGRNLRIAGLVAGTLVLLAGVVAVAFAALGGDKPPADPVAAVTTTATIDSRTTRPTAPATTTSGPRTNTTHTAPPRPETTEAPSPGATTVTAPPATEPVGAAGGLKGAVVVVDPGHQGRGNSAQEPIGPGSSRTKDKVTSGTSGVATGTNESTVTLAIGLKLRDALQARGIKVVMTRTSQNIDISNIARTKIANQAHADLFIRVHADGAENSSTHGIHTLYPATIKGWTDDIAGPSKRAAQLAQQALVAATGAADRGLDARDDMTGFNWSDVPVIIPELGFMSNPEEDRLLNTASYQQKIANALADAAVRFIKERRAG